MNFIIRLIFALLVTFLITYRAYKKKSLNKSGCVAAFLVGFLMTLSNFCNFFALLVFFYSSNKATKFCEEMKKNLDDEFKENGQRNYKQVLCNGIIPTVASVFMLLDCGYGEKILDFHNNYNYSIYSIMIVSSLSSSCGDTFSSEIGPVLGENLKYVYHIVKFEKVPKGTNGGISFYGTLASFFGGFLVGLGYFMSNIFMIVYFNSYSVLSVVKTYPIIIIGTLGGFLGSIIDSILGGSLQYTGFDTTNNKVSKYKGVNVIHISGFDILSNNQVNLASSFITSILITYMCIIMKLF